MWLSSLDFKCGLKLRCAWSNAAHTSGVRTQHTAHSTQRTPNAVNEHFSLSIWRQPLGADLWSRTTNPYIRMMLYVAPNDWLHTSNATTRISYFIDKLKYFVVFVLGTLEHFVRRNTMNRDLIINYCTWQCSLHSNGLDLFAENAETEKKCTEKEIDGHLSSLLLALFLWLRSLRVLWLWLWFTHKCSYRVQT